METIREQYALPLARIALELGAVKLSAGKPFRWASGALMPVYNDNRLLLARPDARELIVEAFSRLLQERGFRPENIAGTATAGIPHAALLADRLHLPMSYVRADKKDHGLQKQVEGIDSGYRGMKVLLIEDLISTGKSSAEAVEAVRAAGGECTLTLAIFTYGFDTARQTFAHLTPPCQTATILDWDILLEAALKSGAIRDEEASLLAAWRQAPFEWGKKHELH